MCCTWINRKIVLSSSISLMSIFDKSWLCLFLWLKLRIKISVTSLSFDNIISQQQRCFIWNLSWCLILLVSIHFILLTWPTMHIFSRFIHFIYFQNIYISCLIWQHFTQPLLIILQIQVWIFIFCNWRFFLL